MKKKKLFGIGAVVLMISIAFIPITNGTQINTGENENKINILNMNNSCDLELTVIQKPKILIDQSPKITGEGEDAEVYSVYQIKYEIKNNYYYPYDDYTITYIADTENPNHWLYSWEDELDLEPGETETFTKTFDVICSLDENLDMEHYFTDQQVLIETLSGGPADINSSNNFKVENVVNYFDTDEDDATTSQLFASAPNRDETKTKTIGNVEVDYEIISELHEKDNVLSCFRSRGKTLEDYINTDEFQNIKDWAEAQPLGVLEDLWAVIEQFLNNFSNFMDFFWYNFTESWHNHRFGWVKDFTRYFIPIVVEAALAVLVGASCVWTISTTAAFGAVTTWITAGFAILNALAVGNPITDAMLDAFFGAVAVTAALTALTFILGEIIVCGGIEAFLLGKILKYDIPRLQDWAGQAPWMDDIRIYGTVYFVCNSEKITVECRTSSTNETAPDKGDNKHKIAYSFYTPAKISGEKTYFTPKKCKITVSGNHPKHEGKDLTNWPYIFSYCFPGGEVYKVFQDPRWIKIRDRSALINNPMLRNLILRLLEIFEDRPLLNIMGLQT